MAHVKLPGVIDWAAFGDRIGVDALREAIDLATGRSRPAYPISTGSRDLDGVTEGGFRRGAMYVVAGSSYAVLRGVVQSAIAAAQERGERIGVVGEPGRKVPQVEIASREVVDWSKAAFVTPDTAETALAYARAMVESDLDLVVLDATRPRFRPPKSAFGPWSDLPALGNVVDLAREAGTCLLLVKADGTAVENFPVDLPAPDQLLSVKPMVGLKGSGRRVRVSPRPWLDAEKAPQSPTSERPESATVHLSPQGRVDVARDLLELTSRAEIVSRDGWHYRYGDIHLGHGLDESAHKIEENPTLEETLLDEAERYLERTTGVPRASSGSPPSERVSLSFGLKAREDSEAAADLTANLGAIDTLAERLNIRLEPESGEIEPPTESPPGSSPTDAQATESESESESEDAEATPPSAEPRFVNSWFEGDPPVLPLVVDRRALLKINIGNPRADAANAAPFAEPDFAGEQSLALLFHLYSTDFDIEEKILSATLPRAGDSKPVSTWVTPRHAPSGTIRIVVSAGKDLEILQRLEMVVDVVERSKGATP